MKILANRNSLQGIATYYAGLFGFVGSCIAITKDAGTWALVGFSLGLTLTILQDIHWFRRRRAHPHDIRLVEKLTNLFQQTKTDLFLNQHDFETLGYDDSQLAPLIEIEQRWQGVEYEFVNSDLGRHWSHLRNRLSQLTDVLTRQDAMAGANFHHLAPSTNKNQPGFDEQIQQARRANELARTLFGDFQEIRRLYLRYKALLDMRT